VSCLLDANTLSELRKPRPHPAIARWYAGVADDELEFADRILPVTELRPYTVAVLSLAPEAQSFRSTFGGRYQTS
jgi:hypothetical protein